MSQFDNNAESNSHAPSRLSEKLPNGMSVEDGLRLWQASSDFLNDKTKKNEEDFVDVFNTLQLKYRRAPRPFSRLNRFLVSIAAAISLIFSIILFGSRVPLLQQFATSPTNESVDKCPSGMVFVDSGDFLMGNPTADTSANNYPLRTIYIDSFCIDRTEVSNLKYLEFLAADRRIPPTDWPLGNANSTEINQQDAERLPVVNIDWNAANDYCRWWGKSLSIEAQLPTEAQWEKAARGTDGRLYPWGNELPIAQLANFAQTFPEPQISAVDTFPSGASPYHVLNMAGNVSEWVFDWYKSDWYAQMPERNPVLSERSVSGTKVTRGGSYTDSAPLLQTISRNGNYRPDDADASIGFRCAHKLTNFG